MRNRYDGDLAALAVSGELREHEFFYNYQRPHTALEFQTPNECLVALEAA